MYENCIAYLKERGVEIEDIANCVMYLQAPYHPEIEHALCCKAVCEVLRKREVQHVVLTGLCLDQAAQQNLLMDEQLCDILRKDTPLYGVDEVLAYGICNVYGSIALTNYGYVDRIKPGILSILNEPHSGVCNTFLDDIVGAIAAAAASKIAHNCE